LIKKYDRPVKDIPIRKINDKKLKGNLRKSEKKTKEAMERAAQSELLLTEESGYLFSSD
jgi:U3 small nucleolar RNA-associated protein 7